VFEQTVHDVLHDSIVQINTDVSTGSGVVYDSKGDIVTNAHVVERAGTVQVLRSEGTSLLPARVIAIAAGDDLAVIRVQAGADTLRPARFGNSDDLKIGEFVLAMGDPLGLTDSVTQGGGKAAGIGFAIPSNTIERVAAQLIARAPPA
jgi:putative serine protease PepD